MYNIKYLRGNTYYIDENGSIAIIKNVLYIKGLKAIDGSYQIETIKGTITLLVTNGVVVVNA